MTVRWVSRAAAAAMAVPLVLAGPVAAPAAAAEPPYITSAGAMACPSATSCWEIGPELGRATLLHGVGSHRTKIVAPALPGSTATGSVGLFGITCTSVSDCWVVGSASRSRADTDHPYAAHWDGRRWKSVTMKSPGQASPLLLSVSCSTPRNCWAVGYAYAARVYRPLAMHWNGAAWAVSAALDPPAPQGSIMNSVSCTAGGCLVAGATEGTATGGPGKDIVWHRAAGAWRPTAITMTGGAGAGTEPSIACTSTTDCWIVGSAVVTLAQPTLNWSAHWNGRRWTPVSIPSPAGTGPFTGSGNVVAPFNLLSDLKCATPKNCWAIGAIDGPATRGKDRPEVLHWNGRAWAVVAVPTKAGDQHDSVGGVACAPKGPCLIDLSSYGPTWKYGDRTLRWNGGHWVA